MSPPPSQRENETSKDLIQEVKRVTLSLKSLQDDIQKNKHNLLLLVGLITSRIMTFTHAADEYGKFLQLNPAHFGFSVSLLKQASEDIDTFFWEKLNQFENKFCRQPNFFKSINWAAAKTQLNSILQTVFQTLSGINGTIDTLRRKVESNDIESDLFKNHLKTELLKCIDALKGLVTVGKNRYLPMPNVQEIVSLIEPIKSITPTTRSTPELVAC